MGFFKSLGKVFKGVTGISLVEKYLNAPKEAAKTQAEAAAAAGNLEYSQYLQTRDDLLEKQKRYEEGSYEQAERFNPYIDAGSRASQLQRALSGALGTEAQKEAYSQYQESPAVAFQREQGMRGLEQNLTAGGIGGGTRLKELSRFNQGLAQQDFNNYYNRLGAQSDVGASALTDQINTRLNALSGNVNQAQNIGLLGQTASAGRADALNAAAAARAGGQLGKINQITGLVQTGAKVLGGL